MIKIQKKYSIILTGLVLCIFSFSFVLAGGDGGESEGDEGSFTTVIDPGPAASQSATVSTTGVDSAFGPDTVTYTFQNDPSDYNIDYDSIAPVTSIEENLYESEFEEEIQANSVSIVSNLGSDFQVCTSNISQPACYDSSRPTPTFNWTFTGFPSQASYWVEADNNGNFSSPEISTGEIASSNKYHTVFDNASNGLLFNTTYKWKVAVKDSYNSWSDWASSDVAFITNSRCTPPAPSNLSGSVISCSRINLSWTDNSNNEDGFKIERKTGSSGSWSQIDTVGANIINYSSTSLSPGANYYYRVRAYNSGGNSGYSNDTNKTTQGLTSTDIKANGSNGPIAIVYNTAANLSWTSVNANSCSASGSWSGDKSTSGSQSTGNLTSSKTYTLTCAGDCNSDNDSVTVNTHTSTLSVTLLTDPTSGNAPLNNVDLTATVGGTEIGTMNYTFYCNRSDSGTNITAGWAAKYDGISQNPKKANSICDYASSGTYATKVIVERGSLAVESRQTVTVLNSSPTVSNLNRSVGDYCTTPSYYFSWTYSDSDGDTETRYNFQVDNNSSFSSPEIDRNYINLSNPSPTTNNQTVIVTVDPASDRIVYNTTYYWRVKVYDSGGLNSGWISGPSFTTDKHEYPTIDFNWNPSNPSQGEDTLFSDLSTVYGGSNKSAWLWTFIDAIPITSNLQNPFIRFNSNGSKQATLKVTDSDNYSCSGSNMVNVQSILPGWEEN